MPKAPGSCSLTGMATIAFTGGGTGGHVYPGLAVIERIRERSDHSCFWIGSNRGMDRSIVEAAGVPFVGIPSGKLRRYFSLENALDALRVGAGFFAARSTLSRRRPALLFSKGGFVSVPPCAAAASLGIPCFTHESDYSPGLATRLNARWAERILTAYPETGAMLGGIATTRAIAVGNPVRPAFFSASRDRGRAALSVGPDEPVVLVLGGSQGARQLNELVAGTLPALSARCTVVHQTGAGAEKIPPAGKRYRPTAYISDGLPDLLAAADLVVARSGAGTIWEAATAGKPMVLVPLTGSGTRGDQVENAERFVAAGAAVSLVGPGATAETFLEAVVSLLADPDRRRTMAASAAELARGDASAAIADLVIQRVGGTR